MGVSKQRYALFLAAVMFPAIANAEQLLAEIDEANKAFAKAILGSDIDYLVNDYTEDGCIIAPSTPKTCGKEAIRSFWSAVIASNPNNVEIITLTAEGGSGTAFATGDLRITDSAGKLHENRFVLVYKKSDDNWKLHIDSWTPK
ncbi:MAG: YybH family protein [Gammaproteobacteria bacterium]